MIRSVFLSVCMLSFGSSLIAADSETIQPFNGVDLTGWKLKGDAKKSKWKVASVVQNGKQPKQLQVDSEVTSRTGQLVNMEAGGVDISTEAKFGDGTYELEFMIPKDSNSGIYIQGEYEVQIFDSYGKEKLGQGDLGAIYSAAAPRVNAAKKPGEWQQIVIEFRAPRFEGDKKVANARFLKVTLNGQIIQENVEVKGSTGGALVGKEAPLGPLMFQGDHGPVAFRNIKITPKK